MKKLQDLFANLLFGKPVQGDNANYPQSKKLLISKTVKPDFRFGFNDWVRHVSYQSYMSSKTY